MKLYATTTSERATKGQGGNDFLINDIFITDREQQDYRIETIVYNGSIETRIYKRKMFYNSIKEKYTEIYKDIIYTNATE